MTNPFDSLRHKHPLAMCLDLSVRYAWRRVVRREACLRFRCNICGRCSEAPRSDLKGRETPSCRYCGSSLRFRTVVHALALALFGRGMPLPEFPDSKHVAGIGLSDAPGYARRLPRKFAYTNTFYHKEPRLDIAALPGDREETADFVIASDVFEHVAPPVEPAIANLYKLLKPGGICVFSVPYKKEGETDEHFPNLFRYRIEKRGRRRILVNETRDGVQEVFEPLRFHGGKGATLQMRLFAERSLLGLLREAGFVDVRLHGDSVEEFGILWAQDHSLVMSMRKPGRA